MRESNSMTPLEYQHLQEQVTQAYDRLTEVSQRLREVSQDGTNDENPLFATTRQEYEVKFRDYHSLNQKLQAAVIVKPEFTDDKSVISETVSSFSIRMTDINNGTSSNRTFTIGFNILNNEISPKAPLFVKIKGQPVGFKCRFNNYDVEIIEII